MVSDQLNEADNLSIVYAILFLALSCQRKWLLSTRNLPAYVTTCGLTCLFLALLSHVFDFAD
jgi:hypothetical protein